MAHLVRGILFGVYLCIIRGKKGLVEQVIVNKIVMLIMSTCQCIPKEE